MTKTDIKYGSTVTGKKYTSVEAQSVRDLTRIWKPKDARHFVDNWLIPKYPRFEGSRNSVLKLVQDEMAEMQGGGVA